MKTLKCKYFQYTDQLCDWVNGTSKIPSLKRDPSVEITVVSITSVDRFTANHEGYNLFYYEHREFQTDKV